MFRKVFYYKLNATKSYILDLKLDATTKNLLQAQYPFFWPDKSISYLGIHLTRSVKHLFSANYKPLLTKLHSETQSIINQELSWSGRLAAFKMLHLPKILYLFRTIPVTIPKYYFKSQQTLFNKCIWKGSKPRCAHSKFFKHKLAGGSGTIDFEDYYTASLLDQLTKWFHQCHTKLWSNIENLSLVRPNLKCWLMSISLGNKLPSALSPTMLATVKAWQTLIRESGKNSTNPAIPIPLASLHYLSPDLSLSQ